MSETVEKKMLWKMHVIESQRHWNLLKPVIIFILTLLVTFWNCLFYLAWPIRSRCSQFITSASFNLPLVSSVYLSFIMQKQPFGDVIKNNKKIKKTPVLESLFNNVQTRRRFPAHVFFCEYCKIYRPPLVSASDCFKIKF